MNTTCLDTLLLEGLQGGTGRSPSLFAAFKLRTHYRRQVQRHGLEAMAEHLHAIGVPVDVAAWLLTGTSGSNMPPETWVKGEARVEVIDYPQPYIY